MKSNTLEMIRNIRDENHKQCKGMSFKKKIEYTRKMAKEWLESMSKKGKNRFQK